MYCSLDQVPKGSGRAQFRNIPRAQSSMVETYRDHGRNISCLGPARSNTFASVGHNRKRPSFVEHGRKILKQSSMVESIEWASPLYEVPVDPN